MTGADAHQPSGAAVHAGCADRVAQSRPRHQDRQPGLMLGQQVDAHQCRHRQQAGRQQGHQLPAPQPETGDRDQRQRQVEPLLGDQRP